MGLTTGSGWRVDMRGSSTQCTERSSIGRRERIRDSEDSEDSRKETLTGREEMSRDRLVIGWMKKRASEKKIVVIVP